MKDIPLTILFLALATQPLPAQEVEEVFGAPTEAVPAEATPEAPPEATPEEPAEATPEEPAATGGVTFYEPEDTPDKGDVGDPEAVTPVETPDTPAEGTGEALVDTPAGIIGDIPPARPVEEVTDAAAQKEREAQEGQNQDELRMCAGIAILRDMVSTLNSAQNVSTADGMAQSLHGDLDRLREWKQDFEPSLGEAGFRELYNKRYRATAESLCLGLAELCIRLVDADYLQSEDLRHAIFRMSQELPQAFALRENAVWTCSGIVELAMLDQVLACIANETTAEKHAAKVQEIVDALQAWRSACRPDGADHATRHNLKSYRSFIERENLRIAMQAKRITYANYFNSPALGLAIAPVADSVADVCALPKEEQHICNGIVLLGVLENILAQVKDPDSARAATTPIMRLSNELQQWGQDFATLPEPDEATMQRYEKRYLPRIEQLNDRIKAQGARIASAEFYRSRELPAALLRLIMNFQ